MHENIRRSLSDFELGEIQSTPIWRGGDIMPKFRRPGLPDMKEALEKAVLIVTEVSEGGSVPNLKVANKGDAPILLLDGEEVAGAKQNRVLNTTILVGGKSEVVIPVSCTEQGRWTYSSREFFEIGQPHVDQPRMVKNRSVNVAYVARAKPARTRARSGTGSTKCRGTPARLPRPGPCGTSS